MKKVLSAVLTVIMLLSMSVSAFAADAPASASASAYYNETVYISAEDMVVPLNSEEAGTPIGQVVQTVYVKETFSDDGVLLESRLMNKQEVDAYKTEIAERLLSGERVHEASDGTRSFPSDDTTSQGELTITLTVYDRGGNIYSGWADAQWTNGIWILPNGEERPGNGKDYLAVTWGGNGQFKQKSKSISGNYQYDQGSISFSQAEANSYAGYCWQFDETKWNLLTRYYADSIRANVVIEKTYSTLKNKETAMRMTYIHTYDKLSGTVEFSIDKSGVTAAGVSLTTVEDQWQIEVDIAGLIY